ncbi:MAG: dTMP kinase [Pseudomonadota bacterium]|nr:dTMP kinase [Pseudomonadota bacterium]
MSLFITLEGIEGTGKSTLIQTLAISLRDQDIPVTVTREPGGSPLAEKIRQVVLKKGSEHLNVKAELLLMYAARAQHIAETIQPALANGHVVLCDRYYDASHAYQGFGRGVDNKVLRDLDAIVVSSHTPDLTLLLDAPIDLCLDRTKKRKQSDRFDKESHIFFTQVQQGYRQRALDFPDRIVTINVDAAPEVVQDLAYDIIMKKIAAADVF